MKAMLEDIPRLVLISVSTIVGALVLFGILLPTLGAARDAAIVRTASLSQQITTTNGTQTQLAADVQFVLDNQAAFDELIQSDRLIPHTRRTAIAELQRLAVARGLTNLNYSFQAAGEASPEMAGSQPASGAYKVSLEQVELRVGAPFDGPIYGFINDLTKSFPGSAVVQSITMSRPPQVTDTALKDVSDGRDSRLVEGTVLLSWRTAQAAAEDASGR